MRVRLGCVPFRYANPNMEKNSKHHRLCNFKSASRYMVLLTSARLKRHIHRQSPVRVVEPVRLSACACASHPLAGTHAYVTPGSENSGLSSYAISIYWMNVPVFGDFTRSWVFRADVPSITVVPTQSPSHIIYPTSMPRVQVGTAVCNQMWLWWPSLVDVIGNLSRASISDKSTEAKHNLKRAKKKN